ncbi:methionine--tRNA ligase [Thermocoleostomius sinensis]|uniref:methionine--tRNA ligase n=1 Tax=Thermocoleostomius sinensis A174 TaxID=2016057 RepID=A0A9E8ZGR9_9CYAN|nr:methionine--tRNA ligase [Thermocoleostomius sinensis]WAL61544.1 methionine--tRNA ligase [Thermocoleostomius sinensis A174]
MSFNPIEQDASIHNTFAITTPLYYVNASPHIGSAYTTIAADVLARYYRLRGKQVRMMTGTDEHGQKIQRTALEAGRTPQEHCDLVVQEFEVLWSRLNIQSARLPVPGQVFGHGFLTKDGQKMGKSLGNVIDPYDLVDRYGSDAVRYYFLKEIEFGRASDFNEARFINILNADLANDLGNLLNRTLKMVQKYCQGQVPRIPLSQVSATNRLQSLGETLGKSVADAYENLAFSQACEAVLGFVQAGNKFIDEQAPWSLYKQGNQTAVEHVLYTILESVRLSAYLLSPIIPKVSSAVYQQLGFLTDFNTLEVGTLVPYHLHATWGILPGGQILGEPQPVFQRLDPPVPSQ